MFFILIKSNFRIPLVPRRPVSPDPNVAAKAKQDKSKKKPGDPSVDSPQPPQDPDEKLIFDAHSLSTAAIEKIVSLDNSLIRGFVNTNTLLS